MLLDSATPSWSASTKRAMLPAPNCDTYTDPSGASAMNRGPLAVAKMLMWKPVGTYSTCPAIGMLSMPAGRGAAARSLRQAAAATTAATSNVRLSPPLSAPVRLLSPIRHPPDLAAIVVRDQQ